MHSRRKDRNPGTLAERKTVLSPHNGLVRRTGFERHRATPGRPTRMGKRINEWMPAPKASPHEGRPKIPELRGMHSRRADRDPGALAEQKPVLSPSTA